MVENQSRQIMIVTGEASGDLHGANLIQSIHKLVPELICFGMGGKALQNAGVDILFEAARVSVVGVTEVFSHLGDILAARRTLIQAMRERKPSLLIIIDFPDFNLILAAKAKKLGIPVFYYITPQVWAWRKRRVHTISRLADRVAVILPFEKDFFLKHGKEVDFVGHPLLDSVKTSTTRNEFLASLSVDPARRVIGLLPGSRKKEIISLLPVFLAAAKELTVQSANKYTFLLPLAPTVSLELLEENGLAEYRKMLDIRVTDQDRYDLMASCDAVVAASGTVILELAILTVPTVATYRVSAHTYFLGRLLIHLKWFSLVNLIADRTVIPELLQDEVTPENIARELSNILPAGEKRTAILHGLNEVKEKLGGPGASQRAAEIALSIVNRNEQR